MKHIVTSCFLFSVAMQIYASKVTSIGILSEDNYPSYVHVLTVEEEVDAEFLKRNCFAIDIYDDKTCYISGSEIVAARQAEATVKKNLTDFLRRKGIFQGDQGLNPRMDICIIIRSEDSNYGKAEYRRIEAIVMRVLAQEHSVNPSLKVSLENHMAWGYPPPPPPPPEVDVIEELMIDEDDVVVETNGDETVVQVSDNDEIYAVPDVEPLFPGGTSALMDFIRSTQKLPAEASQMGRVTVSFVVEKDGSLSNFEILRSPDVALSQEALRVMNCMPLWTPGRKNGFIVRTKYMLPITFRKTNEEEK